MLFWKRKRGEHGDSLTSRWVDLLAAVEDANTDLMVVVGPEDGGSVCTDWVGAVVSVSGADVRFPALVDAVEDGLFHPGCRHRLIPYRVEDGEAEALFCTKLAVSGMAQRSRDRRATAESNAAEGEEPRAEFTRYYDLARGAEKAQQPQIALHYCQEALRLLSRREVFDGDDQVMVERVIKGRMQTIFRAHQPVNETGPAVD